MPTPVSVARQCLTQEAAHSLDEAVAVARRRGHAQTTSLHAVSALLSLPTSTLSDACARARNTAYSPRLQFKALELCLSVSLDRVPSTQIVDDPPVSNSLSAAIKRSQANQRRQPENFHLYHQLSQQSSIACVKVELQHLILSILDDPVVSRVFAEAGFRSSEIKLAIIRPFPPVLRYSSQNRGPPLFLCNLSDYSDPGRRSFVFPFSGFPGSSDGDENSRRIGEVMCRNKGRNPLLVGVCSYDALKSFTEAVEKRIDSVLPSELFGLRIISMETNFSRLFSQSSDKGSVDLKLREVGQIVEQNLGPGIAVNFGDLKAFVSDNVVGDIVSHVVDQLTKLVEVHGQKAWLIGATASYETYLKFVSRFPSIEKDWGLELLPITSLRPSMSESFPRSSFMESFVPFGGFFSTLSDFKVPPNGSYQHLTRCCLCNKKFEQEASSISNDVKTKDDGQLLSAKIPGLQRKWDNICRLLHNNNQLVAEEKVFPTTLGFQVNDDKRETENNRSDITEASSNKSKSLNANPCISMDLPKCSFLSRLMERSSKTEELESVGHMSPPSTASVTTDLGLGLCSPPNFSMLKKPPLDQYGKICNKMTQSLSCSSPEKGRQFVPGDFKALFRELNKRISWQNEAVTIISQTIAHCQARRERPADGGGNLRGDMWFSFDGPDFLGKKKTALALSEILFGDRHHHFISIDLNSQNEVIDLNDYDVKLRGKTAIDFLAGELSKRPLSVVLLENVDKADLMMQNTLSRAIRTGKILDLNGREVSIRNSIFVTTTFSEGKGSFSSGKYSEERILKVRVQQIRVEVDHTIGQNKTESDTERKEISNAVLMTKRKLINESNLGQHENSKMVKRANTMSNRYLDLNLPAEENEVQENDDGNSNDRAWLQDFCDIMDQKVIFKPFDFDALADKILEKIKNMFHKIYGSDCLLEIESKVMDQLLAASYISYGSQEVEDWMERVLSRGFAEVKRCYGVSTNSTVKLVTCEDLGVEDQVPGVCVPLELL